MNHRLRAAAVAAGALALVGGAALTASASSDAIPAGTIHGCVYEGANRTLERVYTSPTSGTTCPAGTFQVVWSITGPRGPAGPPGPPGTNGTSAGPLTVTSVIHISNDPDSSPNTEPSDAGYPAGTWAVDTITRTVTVTRHSAVDASNCGGTPTCWFYTGTVSDSGSWVSLAGANSPGSQDVAITGTASGGLTGGSDFQFYASGSALHASSVSSIDNTENGTFSGTSDTYWPKLFVSGVDGGTYSLLNSWGWTYTNGSCGAEQWVNAAAGNSGDVVGSGGGCPA